MLLEFQGLKHEIDLKTIENLPEIRKEINVFKVRQFTIRKKAVNEIYKNRNVYNEIMELNQNELEKEKQNLDKRYIDIDRIKTYKSQNPFSIIEN